LGLFLLAETFSFMLRYWFVPKKDEFMTDNRARQQAESVFNREQRRDREIAAALELEAARHQAVIENMKRLRALRLSKTVVEAENS
jgi:hypothetical protein